MVLERDLGSIPKGRSMKDMNKLFFELIQVAIGKRECMSHTPKADEWKTLYDMALKQSLVGICFAGVQNLQKQQQSPQEMLYLQWMGLAAKIQQRNEVVNKQCAELVENLKVRGYRTCVLKGQGVAALYDNLANLRQSGDIDLWVDATKEKVVALARKTGSEEKASYLHVGAKFFKDTDVELHYRPTYMRCLRHNKRMQEWCESFKVSSSTGSPTMGFGGFKEVNGMVVPSCEFNVVYLLSHIYRHLFGLGIGLRQLMDYYFSLRAVSEGFNVSEVSSTLKKLGLYDFAGAVIYVLKEVFGLEREYMICKPDEWRGKVLLECVMESGNFGKVQKQMPTWLQKTKQWTKLVQMYPSETLSDPVWRFVRHFDK